MYVCIYIYIRIHIYISIYIYPYATNDTRILYLYIYTYYTHAMLRLMSFRQSSLSVAMTQARDDISMHWGPFANGWTLWTLWTLWTFRLWTLWTHKDLPVRSWQFANGWELHCAQVEYLDIHHLKFGNFSLSCKIIGIISQMIPTHINSHFVGLVCGNINTLVHCLSNPFPIGLSWEKPRFLLVKIHQNPHGFWWNISPRPARSQPWTVAAERGSCWLVQLIWRDSCFDSMDPMRNLGGSWGHMIFDDESYGFSMIFDDFRWLSPMQLAFNCRNWISPRPTNRWGQSFPGRRKG